MEAKSHQRLKPQRAKNMARRDQINKEPLVEDFNYRRPRRGKCRAPDLPISLGLTQEIKPPGRQREGSRTRTIQTGTPNSEIRHAYIITRHTTQERNSGRATLSTSQTNRGIYNAGRHILWREENDRYQNKSENEKHGARERFTRTPKKTPPPPRPPTLPPDEANNAGDRNSGAANGRDIRHEQHGIATRIGRN